VIEIETARRHKNGLIGRRCQPMKPMKPIEPMKPVLYEL
jgi:hypothetical protein